MSKKVGKPIVETIFGGIELEFRLFQNHCETIEAVTSEQEEGEGEEEYSDLNPLSCSIATDSIDGLKKTNKSQVRFGHDKPQFLKNLSRAFGIYPQWNLTNTV